MTTPSIRDVILEGAQKNRLAVEEMLRHRRAIQESLAARSHITDIATQLSINESRMSELAESVIGDAASVAQLAIDRYTSSSSAAFDALQRAVVESSLRLAPGWLLHEKSSDALAKQIRLDGTLSALQTAHIMGAVGDLKKFGDSTAGFARMVTQIESSALGVLKSSLAMDRAWESVRQMAVSADLTWTKFASEPARLAALSPNLARAPSIEIYSAVRGSALLIPAQDSSVLDEIDEVELEVVRIADRFEARVEDFDPELLTMYQGALERIDQGGIDWQRQALICFRELVTHTLHTVAPDKKVLPWARPEHFSNGKLTRQARVEFIFREDSKGDLAPFMQKDLAAALELFDLLNKVHKKRPAITQKQFRILQYRLQGLIDTFLEASGH